MFSVGGFLMGGWGFGVSALVVLVVVAVGGSLAPAAFAVTVVSGDGDANAPLVIDPSSDPEDPLVTTATGARLVMFVQRMPVTKVVSEVTVGDLALGPGCSSGTANAKIEEYDNREIGGAGGVYYSTGAKPMSTTPSKIAWQFDPVVFRKDRGYAINVSVSGCASFNQTTWAHNEGEVNPGQVACAKGPQGWRRMWHQSGLDDRVAGCVDRPPGQGSFDSSMPTGWLVSQVAQNGSGLWDVRKFSTPSSPVCYTPYYPNTYDAFGAAPTYWRQSSAFPFNPEYTCRWTQWADWGEQPEHGWYYALPWLTERSGAPRDMYLKLDTVDYSELLERHAPILAFDWDENFYPQDAGAFSNFAEIPTSGYEADSDFVNVLYDEPGEMIAAAGSPGPGAGEWPYALTLDALGTNYGFGEDPLDQPLSLPGDYIDARGSTEAQYSADSLAQHTEGYEDVVYGRILHDPTDDRLWLQYWVFYYFNSFSVLGVGVHEGDWEMVQVALSSSGVPQEATFAAHDYGFKLAWQDVDKGGVAQEQPIVYVAARSHASYPASGETDIQGVVLLKDQHWGDGAWLTPPLVEVDSGTAWTGWEGRWGASVSGLAPSPANPSQQAKWGSPSAFHAGATEW